MKKMKKTFCKRCMAMTYSYTLELVEAGEREEHCSLCGSFKSVSPIYDLEPQKRSLFDKLFRRHSDESYD